MNTGLTAGIDQMGNINLKVANEMSYKTQARQQAISQSLSLESLLEPMTGAWGQLFRSTNRDPTSNILDLL